MCDILLSPGTASDDGRKYERILNIADSRGDWQAMIHSSK